MNMRRLLANSLLPVILVGGAVAIGAWGARVSVARRTDAQKTAELAAIATTKVEKGDFAVTVLVTGELEAVDSLSVSAKARGQLLYVVPNGTRVKKGDVIAQLDVPRLARDLRDRELDYVNAVDDLAKKKRDLAAKVEQAEIALQRAEYQLEQSRAARQGQLDEGTRQKEYDVGEYELSQSRFEREQTLAKEGLLPEREPELRSTQLKAQEFGLDRQTKNLELLQAEKESEGLDKQAAVEKAEADLARAQNEEKFELRSAEMTVKIREQQLERVKEEMAGATLLSPSNGIVVLAEESSGFMGRRPVEPGDRVYPGRPVASIPDLDTMRVKVDLSEEQVRLVKRKLEAIVTVPAIPAMEFPAEVSEVSQTAGEGTLSGTGMPSGERKFAAYMQIEDRKEALLRPGMTARVQVIVERVEEAVSVPHECVFEREERMVVFVRAGDGFKEVTVELGEENERAVVVTKGLTGGEQVALRDVETSEIGAPEEMQRGSGDATGTGL